RTRWSLCCARALVTSIRRPAASSPHVPRWSRRPARRAELSAGPDKPPDTICAPTGRCRRSHPETCRTMSAWTLDDARRTYSIAHWGEGYFDIDARGQVTVQPRGAGG